MYGLKASGLAIAFVTAIAVLSCTVFGEETSLTAKVTPAISITPPEGIVSWAINPAIINTYMKPLIVNTNADWKITVKGQNGGYMQATSSNGTIYKLHNQIAIAAPGIIPVKPSTTSKTLLEGTTHGANQNYPITFQQQGSFDDITNENSTMPLTYSTVVTFTGSLA